MSGDCHSDEVVAEFMSVKIKFCGEIEALKTKIEKVGDGYLMQFPARNGMHNAGKVSVETIRAMTGDMLKRLRPNAVMSGAEKK